MFPGRERPTDGEVPNHGRASGRRCQHAVRWEWGWVQGSLLSHKYSSCWTTKDPSVPTPQAACGGRGAESLASWHGGLSAGPSLGKRDLLKAHGVPHVSCCSASDPGTSTRPVAWLQMRRLVEASILFFLSSSQTLMRRHNGPAYLSEPRPSVLRFRSRHLEWFKWRVRQRPSQPSPVLEILINISKNKRRKSGLPRRGWGRARALDLGISHVSPGSGASSMCPWAHG